MFELSFRDERYLPFEGAGAISEWSLELFNDLPSNNPDPTNPDFGRPLRQFDYGTITDAVLHVKYTAREDAGPFKNGAISHLATTSPGRDDAGARAAQPAAGVPDPVGRFLNPTNPADGNVFELEMQAGRCSPTRDAGKTLKITGIVLLARCTTAADYTRDAVAAAAGPPPAGANRIILTGAPATGGLHFGTQGRGRRAVRSRPPTPRQPGGSG